MPARRLLCPITLVCILLASSAPAQEAGAKKPLTVDDLYLFDGPRSVTLLPGAQGAVYIRTWIDAKTRQERNSLWLVEGSKEKVRPLEKDEPDARSPVVSPDG